MNLLPNRPISLLLILSIHFFSLSSLSHLNEANIEWPTQLENCTNSCEVTQLDPPSSHMGVALNLTTISHLDNYSFPTNNITSPHDTPQPSDASMNVMKSISHESLQGSTPPPGAPPSIHMVVQEHKLDQSLVVPKDEIITEGKLRGYSPPSGSTPIDKEHMTSLNEEEKYGYVNGYENLIIDGATQDRSSQSSDGFINIVKSIPHESLKGATPPPGSPSPIHIAARSSISRDESYPLKDKLRGNAVSNQDSFDQYAYSSFSIEDHSVDTLREQENDVPLPTVQHH